jgi:dolichyl-phosphate beta-glucosyltransferase
MNSDFRPHLSVIIPAYNEEDRLPGTLEDVLRYLSRQTYLSEVLVVNDGSTDGTQSVTRAHMNESVPLRLVDHADGANHGKGAAVKLGMLQAIGEFRLFMDADNSTTIDQIERFWPALDEGFDIAIGSRKVSGADVVIHQPWYKELSGRAGNLWIRALAVPEVCDTQAGFKVFSRRCALDLFPRLTIDRWGYDVELLAMAHCRGFRVREIPIRWVNSPESKVHPGAYFQVLGEVWRIRRNLKSGMYGPP